MILRPRQKAFVEHSIKALTEHGNTLAVAPTGAGKTVMLSSVLGALGGKRLVLQHRDQLTRQNLDTYKRLKAGGSTGVYNAKTKTFSRDVTFAMVQTLVRHLDKIPPLDVIAIDEAHHAASDSYLKIIHAARQANPDCMVYGVTATPGRSDARDLRVLFDNCADQIQLMELVRAGHLVRPRTFVVDIGVQDQLRQVRKTIADYDMRQVETVMNRTVINDKIVAEWRERAGDRKTVVFTSTIQHAKDTTAAFVDAGVSATAIHDGLTSQQQQAALEDHDQGRVQVLVNCMILTEGWDSQATSCVVLLRPCSHRSAMVQMIGRGLRTVDPERYPGVNKSDCLILDFGTSVLTHGSLESEVVLADDSTKECPACNATLPACVFECAICGHEFPRIASEAVTKDCPDCGETWPLSKRVCDCGYRFGSEKTTISDFVLTEVDLLDDSPFKWESLFSGLVMCANGMESWAMIINYKGAWHAVGRSGKEPVRLLSSGGDKLVALAAANDFLCLHGDRKGASKTRQWVHMPPSAKQLQILKIGGVPPLDMTRYKASCLITWKFNEKQIRVRLSA